MYESRTVAVAQHLELNKSRMPPYHLNPKNLLNVNFSKVFVKMDIESRDK